MPTKTCPICKNKFIAKSNNQIYCNKTCSSKHWKQYAKENGPKYDMYQKQSIIVNCIICGTQFIKRSKNHKCCSNKCYKNHRLQYAKTFRQINHQKIQDYSDEYIKNPENKIRRNQYSCTYLNHQYQTNINHKIKCIVRNRINGALKNNSTSIRSKEALGCTIKYYRNYLESQWQSGWTWENYGEVWEIDHIIPCCAFENLGSDIEQQKKCFHYSNTRPLTKKDNRKKGGKFEKII